MSSFKILYWFGYFRVSSSPISLVDASLPNKYLRVLLSIPITCHLSPQRSFTISEPTKPLEPVMQALINSSPQILLAPYQEWPLQPCSNDHVRLELQYL